MGQAPLVFKLLLCKIGLEMGIHQYQTNYSSSFSGSESTHGCHRAVKLASFISVYCLQLHATEIIITTFLVIFIKIFNFRTIISENIGNNVVIFREK
jgi:hypothetical protein